MCAVMILSLVSQSAFGLAWMAEAAETAGAVGTAETAGLAWMAEAAEIAGAVGTAENNGNDETAFDGYIVKLAEDTPSLLSRSSSPQGTTGAYLVVENLEQARRLPAECVDYIEPNYIVELFDYAVPPNDPLYQSNQWSLQEIHADSAFAQGLEGEGVSIGFIDSGIIAGHEDLDYARITGEDFTGDGETFNGDLTGHGTFAAGVIAAQTENGKGIAGIAPKAKINVYRAFSGKTTTIAAVVGAINAAVEDDCDILNMSLGTTSSSQLLKEAIDEAESKGVILVAAVGNDGETQSASVLKYPAAYNSVIGVGSVGSGLEYSSFSQRNSSVYVTAPGEVVYSLGIAGSQAYTSGNGTSFAAPVVAGMSALALGYDEDITEEGVRYLLKNTSTDKDAVGYDQKYGYGVVDIAAYIAEMKRSFDITYELNGGSLPDGAKTSYVVTEDEFDLPTPTRSGYVFGGWYEASDLSGATTTVIPAGSLGNRKFFAAWTAQNAVALKSVMVDGQAATLEEDGTYIAYLPYGTNLSGLTAGNIVAVPTNETSVVSASRKAGADGEWIIRVSVPGGASLEYALRVEAMQLHAAEGKKTQTGRAAPASLDGLTASEPYVADPRKWFLNGTSETLPDDFSCFATVSKGGGEVSPANPGEGYAISYTPAPEDGGKEAELLVYGVAHGVQTLDFVTLKIDVSKLPESQSVAEPAAAFDRYTQSVVEVVLTMYGNSVAGVSIDNEALATGQYTLSDISADGKTRLILSASAVSGLSIGSHTVEIRMNAKEPCLVTLTVSDSAPSYTVTFFNGAATYDTRANVRVGSTVSLPVPPVQAGSTFGGWYTAEGIQFTTSSKVTGDLSLFAKWNTNSESIGGGTGSTGGGEGGSGNGGDGGGAGGGAVNPQQDAEPVTPSSDGTALAGPSLNAEDDKNMPVWKNTFTDVDEDDWFYEDVRFAVQNGLFKGTNINTFDPDMPLSRAMLVTSIYRFHHQGVPEGVARQSTFVDVPQDAYYSDAVAWAKEAGLVAGYDNVHFGPDESITRQDLAMVLMRYIGMTGTEYMTTQEYIYFADEVEIADYAKGAIQTLNKLGVLNGIGENRIAPRDSATRAQASAMLRRFVEKVQQL